MAPNKVNYDTVSGYHVQQQFFNNQSNFTSHGAIVCNVTMGDQTFIVIRNDDERTLYNELPAICHLGLQEDDPDGEALYVVVMVTVYAIAIGCLIGMLSFRKKKYDKWDQQAGAYLTGMYQRRSRDERLALKLESARHNSLVPGMELLKAISGIDRRHSGMKKIGLKKTPERSAKERRHSCETTYLRELIQENEKFYDPGDMSLKIRLEKLDDGDSSDSTYFEDTRMGIPSNSEGKEVGFDGRKVGRPDDKLNVMQSTIPTQ